MKIHIDLIFGPDPIKPLLEEMSIILLQQKSQPSDVQFRNLFLDFDVHFPIYSNRVVQIQIYGSLYCLDLREKLNFYCN